MDGRIIIGKSKAPLLAQKAREKWGARSLTRQKGGYTPWGTAQSFSGADCQRLGAVGDRDRRRRGGGVLYAEDRARDIGNGQRGTAGYRSGQMQVPPFAVIVPVPAPMFAATVPLPVSVALLPIVRPEASVKVPPASEMVPLVMLSAPPLMVRAPLAPIASVWVLLAIAIGAAAVAVFSILRTEPATLAIASVGPLATVPVRCSVPPLFADMVPASAPMFAATVRLRLLSLRHC